MRPLGSPTVVGAGKGAAATSNKTVTHNSLLTRLPAAHQEGGGDVLEVDVLEGRRREHRAGERPQFCSEGVGRGLSATPEDDLYRGCHAAVLREERADQDEGTCRQKIRAVRLGCHNR
jgi:hypothetical protein